MTRSVVQMVDYNHPWSREDFELWGVPAPEDKTPALVLPAGRYFVGDPCYVFETADDLWQAYVEVIFHEDDSMDSLGVALLNGLPLAGVSTAYGDGYYQGSDGVGYGVDSGSLGLVHELIVKRLELPQESLEQLSELGSWVTFTEPVEVSRTPEGLITLGHITIPTD